MILISFYPSCSTLFSFSLLAKSLTWVVEEDKSDFIPDVQNPSIAAMVSAGSTSVLSNPSSPILLLLAVKCSFLLKRSMIATHQSMFAVPDCQTLKTVVVVMMSTLRL